MSSSASWNSRPSSFSAAATWSFETRRGAGGCGACGACESPVRAAERMPINWSQVRLSINLTYDTARHHRVFAEECRILEEDRIDEETGEQRRHAIVSARDANQSESRRYFQQAAH